MSRIIANSGSSIVEKLSTSGVDKCRAPEKVDKITELSTIIVDNSVKLCVEVPLTRSSGRECLKLVLAACVGQYTVNA